MILSHSNQMECPKLAFTVLKGMESPFFLGDDATGGAADLHRGALSRSVAKGRPPGPKPPPEASRPLWPVGPSCR